MKRCSLTTIVILLMLCTVAQAQQKKYPVKKKQHAAQPAPLPAPPVIDLPQKLHEIIGQYKANIGVAVMNLETGDTLMINDDHRYPMQSVFKLPLAVFVLQKVDSGLLTLDQPVKIMKADLQPTYSPLRDKYPEGNISLTVKELLEYSVMQSDNNACDILFRLVHGTNPVNLYMHRMGIKNMAISATEKEMTVAWEVQYTNWTQPSALVQLLAGIYQGRLLSASGTALLLKLMTESTTGPERIKGMLPPGTPVAHKTGTSGTNPQGMTAAINDAGIITLPGGRHVALAVLVSNITETPESAEKIIAQVAQAVYNRYAVSGK